MPESISAIQSITQNYFSNLDDSTSRPDRVDILNYSRPHGMFSALSANNGEMQRIINGVSEKYIAIENVIYPSSMAFNLSGQASLPDSGMIKLLPNLLIGEETSLGDESGATEMPDSNDIMKYIDILDKDRRDMEKRISDDRKESEQRIASYISTLDARITKIDEKLDKQGEKLDQQKADSIKAEREHRTWSIATILTIAGLVIAAFYGTAQIVVSIMSKS